MKKYFIIYKHKIIIKIYKLFDLIIININKTKLIKNKIKRKKCQEWEENNYKEDRILMYNNNLSGILKKKKYAGIVKIKMLHQVINVNIVNYPSK